MAPKRELSNLSEAGPKARPLLILASTSPRRRTLLEQHGFEFEVVAPEGIDETAPPYLSPGETVLKNARAKARAVARKRQDALVLGVDTEVFFEGRVLGKPADMEDAFRMLSGLNGRVHEVYSGVWMQGPAGGRGFIEVTRVHFQKRTAEELRRYLQRIEPLDKAGAYAAQNDNGEMIARVEGSYSNVVGLPMERLAEELGAETLWAGVPRV
jgi:septum formation protein